MTTKNRKRAEGLRYTLQCCPAGEETTVINQALDDLEACVWDEVASVCHDYLTSIGVEEWCRERAKELRDGG